MEFVLNNQTVYELAVVYYPKTGEDYDASVKVVKSLIEKSNGQVESEDIWDVQDLAYPIKKQTAGIYTFYQLTFSSPDKIYQLTNGLNISNHVLRHLLVKVDQKRADKAKALAEKLAKQKAINDQKSEDKVKKVDKDDSKTEDQSKEEAEPDKPDKKEEVANNENQQEDSDKTENSETDKDEKKDDNEEAKE